MKKKLSKTEKIKRLRVIKKELKEGYCFFMCHNYIDKFRAELFIDIPELHRFRSKETSKDQAWYFFEPENYKGDSYQNERKIKAIDKAIKLIQSK